MLGETKWKKGNIRSFLNEYDFKCKILKIEHA